MRIGKNVFDKGPSARGADQRRNLQASMPNNHGNFSYLLIRDITPSYKIKTFR